MKITIDTQVDSHEDIKKAIKLLKHIVGMDTNEIEIKKIGEKKVDSTSLMGMFGNTDISNYNNNSNSNNFESSGFSNNNFEIPKLKEIRKQEDIPDTPPDFSALMKLARGNENKGEAREEPKRKIEFF